MNSAASAPGTVRRFVLLLRPSGWLSGAKLWALMPYLYGVVLAAAIIAFNPDLILGPRALDVRATALLPLALVAFGQTLVVFTRGFDLSIGGIISTTSALLASQLTGTGLELAVQLLGLLAFGALAGGLNGLIIARTSLQPFIVTLATWSIWGGVAILFLPQEGGQTSPELTDLVVGNVFGVPVSLIAVAVLFGAWVWLRWSRLVLDFKAIGSDERSAELAGVPVARRKVQVYAISGVFAVLAGIWLAGQFGGGSPTIGNEYILPSVAAVVVGGTSIFGGSGSVAASIAGALALQMIPDLIFVLEISTFWTGFLRGALLLIAVTISSVFLQAARSRL